MRACSSTSLGPGLRNSAARARTRTRGAAARVGTVLALALTLAAVAAPAASSQVQPYGNGDYRGFRNVLPPGTNGLVNAAQLAAYEANPNSKPPHNNDQLAMYSNLTTAAPGITPSQIGAFYKDATFGIPSGQVDSPRTESPEPGVTILRDKSFGVPHIYGDTRPELMFGIGWATAEDRLFFIDVLRHAGQGNLAQFAGGSNVSMDESVWASEPRASSTPAAPVRSNAVRARLALCSPPDTSTGTGSSSTSSRTRS